MCSAEGSADVPFQKHFVVYFFYKSLMLKSVSRNMWGGGGGVLQNSVIFSLHRTRKCNCQQPLTAIVQQHPEFESKIQLQTFV